MMPNEFSNTSCDRHCTLSLLEIAAWQFKNLAHPLIIAGIPSLQRGAVWNAGQIELLWDSILRGFPIGALVLCEKLASQVTRSGKHGCGWDEDQVKYHLLDGQQRCNAIALGFLNAVEDDRELKSGPPATLWLDLAPELPTNSTRQFLFRVLTTAHPWGYQADDGAGYLHVGLIRQAVENYGGGKRPALADAWPHVSKAPIPFSWLTTALFCRGLSGCGIWKDIRERCRSFQGRPWADGAANLLDGHLNSGQYSEHIRQIEEGLHNLRTFTVVALMAPTSALQGISWQERTHGDTPPTDDARISNVEHLFQRLNSGGTELRGEELTFSMIKAHWPGIERSFDALHDKQGRKYQPMPSSRLAALGVRAALIGHGQNEGKDNLPGPLSVSRLRALGYATTGAAKEEKEQLEKYLGIGSNLTDEEILATDLHDNLRQIDEWLLRKDSADDGLPPVLRSSLAQDAPDVFLLLLYLAQKARHDQLSGDQLAALRKPILGLATALHWFGDDRTRAVGSLYAARFRTGELSPKAFEGALGYCMHLADGKRGLLKLPSPTELKRLIPEVEPLDEKLKDWNFWNVIVEVTTDPAGRESRIVHEWPLLCRLKDCKALLLYGQRAFLCGPQLGDFDPSCIDIWNGQARPWDYDHLLPRSTLSSNQGRFREACRQWLNTIGNFRAWPLEKNRSRRDEIANKDIQPDDYVPSLISDRAQCDAFSLSWSEVDVAEKAATFMNAARNRLIGIYADWYNSLEIGRLLEDSESLVALPGGDSDPAGVALNLAEVECVPGESNIERKQES